MTTENSLGALTAGLALYGEHPNAEKWIREACKAVLDEAMNGHLDKLCPDGEDFEGTQYHGARYQGEAIFAWILLKGTGVNAFTRQVPASDERRQLVDLHPRAAPQLSAPAIRRHEPPRHLRAQCPLRSVPVRRRQRPAMPPGTLPRDRSPAGSRWCFDPRRLKPPSEGLPPYKFFRMGMAVVRSGWNIGPDSRDTLFTFMCRDYMLGWHCHQDANHFTLSRRGELAIDSGVYRGNSPHMYDYARRTIAHNSMLIYDPEEPLPAERPHARRRAGLPSRRRRRLDAPTGLTQVAWKTYDTADFKTFGVGDAYYYMCGDATKAYNLKDFKKCEQFTREIVYIKEIDPPLIVIFDRVVATKPIVEKDLAAPHARATADQRHDRQS